MNDPVVPLWLGWLIFIIILSTYNIILGIIGFFIWVYIMVRKSKE